jgi:hypothetical protein
MKPTHFALVVFLFLSTKIFCQKDSLDKAPVYPLKITLENLDKNKKNYKKKSRNLRIKITNQSDTSFSFSIMTCSWDCSFRFKPEIAYRDYWGCLANFPETITLKPKESFTLADKFKFLGSVIKKNITINVGFRVVNPMPNLETDDIKANMENLKKFDSQFDCDPKLTKKDFIWSNTISIRF